MKTSHDSSLASNDASADPKANDAHTQDVPNVVVGEQQVKRGIRFWLIMLSLCLTLSLSALELTAVSTALPTIVSALNGSDFVWVGVAYALASTAILPMTGGIAQIFGRKPAVLSAMAIFTVGSTVCGSAKSMRMLIAGRTVQGLGGGGILSFNSIILGDLVPLNQRGLYAGLFGLTWSVAAALGPLVGGILSNENQWRWLFYLNLPLCGVSATLATILLDLPTPPGSIREKLSRMDWIGNLIVISSACSATIALTQGGAQAPWSSARIIAPLVAGILGLCFFFVYEAKFAKHPLVPFHILSNRTSLSGYLQTFFLPVTSLAAIYFIPVYLQAVKNYDAIQSGIFMLGLASIAPAAVIGAVSVKLFQRYRPQIWTGWCLELIGLSLLTTIKVDTHAATTVGYCVIYGVGAGLNYSTQTYPVQAPLPVSSNAHALAFFSFMRSFAGVWGVTLGGAILQNELQTRLPSQFLKEFPSGVTIVYSAIPRIKNLPEPLRSEVRQAFIGSLKLIWNVLVGVCVLGLLASLMMKGLPLHSRTDQKWALKDKEGGTGSRRGSRDLEASRDTVVDLTRGNSRARRSSSGHADMDVEGIKVHVESAEPIDMVVELTAEKGVVEEKMMDEEEEDPTGIDAVAELTNDHGRITAL